MCIDKHIYNNNWCEIKDILLQITEIKSLNLSNMGLTEFPKMSHITIADWVDCSNNQLKTFKGCPQINGNFYCYNNLITSFKDCPIVRGSLYSDFEMFNKVQQYSKEKKISLLEAQVELYNNQDDDILNHLDKFPDLVAYIRMRELNKLLCT